MERCSVLGCTDACVRWWSGAPFLVHRCHMLQTSQPTLVLADGTVLRVWMHRCLCSLMERYSMLGCTGGVCDVVYIYCRYPSDIKIVLRQRVRLCSSIEKCRRSGQLSIYIYFICSYILRCWDTLYIYIRRRRFIYVERSFMYTHIHLFYMYIYIYVCVCIHV